MRRLGVRVPHGAPNEKGPSFRWVFFVCVCDKRDSNPRGRERRESLRWRVEQRAFRRRPNGEPRRKPASPAPQAAWSLMAFGLADVFLVLFSHQHLDSNPRGRERRESLRWRVEQRAFRRRPNGEPRRKPASPAPQAAWSLMKSA